MKKRKFPAKLIMISIITAVSAILNIDSLFSQVRLTDWKTFTSMLTVNGAAVDTKGRIWAGTSGGVFVYDESAHSFKEFRNIGELLSLDITCIKANPSEKKIYIGSSDGVLEIAGEDFQLKHITDIRSGGFSNAIIKDMAFRDSLVFIAGGFGLSVFSINEEVFKESIFRFGSFQPNTIVNKILIDGDSIWLATDAGLAVCRIGQQMPDPLSWSNYDSSNGLFNTQIVSVIKMDGDIYCASGSVIMKKNGERFDTVFTNPDWNLIKDISEYNGKLYISSIYTFSNKENTEYYWIDSRLDGHFIDEKTGRKILLTSSRGLGFPNADSVVFIAPDSPSSNMFLSLSIDSNSDLWATTDYGASQGIMLLHNGNWKNFLLRDYKELKSDGYHRISTGSRTVVSNWGSGFTVIDPIDSSFKIKNYSFNNSPFRGIGGSPEFVIAGESVFDNNGTIWIVNYGGVSDGPTLVALDKNNNFYSFNNQVTFLTDRFYLYLGIDDNNTKWLGAYNETGGLMYYNEQNTLGDQSDDIYGRFTTQNSGLPSNTVTKIIQDKSGILWLGTTSGLAQIFNPSAVLHNSVPTVRKNSLLGTEPINDIYVDALNNKWVATSHGLWVINSDGTEILDIINKNNTPMTTDDIASVVVDNETGRVFIGTREGLFSALTLSVTPLENYKIICYPQPFDPNSDKEVVIDGLSADSYLKILTVSGDLVKTLTVSGRKTVWDGRNEDNKIVPTGVYIILVSSQSSGVTSVSKLAVVHK